MKHFTNGGTPEQENQEGPEASCDFQIYNLTLIGMRQGTFHPPSFLDQTLSAEFLPKISKLFWKWKLTSIGLIWHPDKLIESYKKCP